MRHPHFLDLAYLGAAFHGWQIQTSLRSVQAVLWKALQAFDPEIPMPQGTGRTDAGVHARAQGVLIQTARIWDPYRLLAAINAHLPPEVRVMRVQPVSEAFWPRHHAVAKRYVYRLMEGPAEDPFQAPFRWHISRAQPLDREAMREARLPLIGHHDFSSFRHQECAAKTPWRHIFDIRLEEAGPFVDLIFEGNRFLMHQVRIMAGTLVAAGKHRVTPQDVARILEARSRSVAPPTAPPHGLCLEKVWYQPQFGVGDPCPWPEAIPES